MNRRLAFLAAFLFPVAALGAGEGLDSLSDDALMTELGSRGMTTLLNRVFEVDKVPEGARSGQLALIAISQLSDPIAKLTPAQKRSLVEQAINGIEGALPSLRDPRALMKATTVLIKESIEHDVNTLEYWGDNPKTQGELRPVVGAVIKMLDKAHDDAQSASNLIANQIKSANDKAAMTRWDELNNLAMTAEYTKNLTNYDLVLAIDKADPLRKTLAESTINFLKDFDTPDQPVRGLVDVRMAKLNMVIGNYDTAIKLFALVAEPDAKNFQPMPDAQQQYEAHYFRVVTEVLAGKVDDAEKAAADLLDWQQRNLPKDKASVDGANAALAMLKYRIASLRADRAAKPAEKKQANEQAIAVLFQLLKDQPGLAGTIFEQLMTKLPDDAPMSALDPLLLQALVHKGEESALKPDALAADTTKTVERAVAATNELTSRAGIDPVMANNAALLKGFLLQKLDRLPEAADAYLDFAVKAANDTAQKQNAELAVRNAEAVVGQLRSDPNRIDDPAAVKVYERLLPVAIGQPFNHTELAYEYAKRLLKQNKPVEAIEYFKLMPADDKRLLFGHYYETIALKQQLDTLKADSASRAPLVSQIQSLADDVRKSAGTAVASAPEGERLAYRSMLAGTSLLAAELARADQKQPERALQLLADFEEQAKGLPDEGPRLTDMLLIRVQSYMALNQTDKATQELLKLLERNPAEGGGLVYNVLTSLNDQLSHAEGTGNADEVRDIARNRARLTGFLVNMARSSKDSNMNKLSYGYAVFDAEVQRYAAMQEPTDADRRAGLMKALDLFKRLDTPDGLAQYKTDLAARRALEKKHGDAASLDPASPDPSGQPEAPPQYDPAVVLGQARTEYDLGDWKEARDRFSRLISEKKLGPAIRISHQNGQEIQSDNDQYWEANYKLLKANFTLDNPTDVEPSKRYLKGLYVREGDHVGGKKWRLEFEKLRADVIPDFDLNNLVAPTSQPVAGK